MTTSSSTAPIFLNPPANVSSDWLSQELSSAETRFQENERQLERFDDNNDEDSTSMSHEDDGVQVMPQARQILQKLASLEETVDTLALAQDVVEWNTAHNNNRNAQQADPSSGEALFRDARACDQLGQVLCRHADLHKSRLYTTLKDEEYEPLHAYVRTRLLLQLRKLIQRSGYPSPDGCARLCPSSSSAMTAMQSTMAQCCDCVVKLQRTHHRVIHHVQYGNQQPPPASPFASGGSCDVLVELVRPLVERIRFHFVDGGKVTATRIDRLPEWLRTYVQENILPSGNINNNNNVYSSPWEVVSLGLAPYLTEDMSALFLNELVSVLQWVLGVARNFFRHDSIVGPNSNPMLLCQAIEQLLLLDDTLRNLLPMEQADRLIRLTDIFVAGDDELLAWWLARERELAFSTLFESSANAMEQEEAASESSTIIRKAWMQSRVAPRAELFCALIQSVQAKASVFSFSGPYLNAVAVPLCMKFLEDVHDNSTVLSNELCRSGGVTIAGIKKKEALRGAELTANLERWIQLINGAHLAAAILTREHPGLGMAPGPSSSVNDLARFGRSLTQLQNVLVEEFAATFVETFLMEQTKLASYLMRCCHYLSHPLDSDDEDEDDGDLSHDLRETQNGLMALLKLCAEDDNNGDEPNFTTGFATRVMRSKVMPLLADKFLEVALGIHDLTPEILPEGAAIFSRDVLALFNTPHWQGDEAPDEPVEVLRLLDIGRMMTMENKSLQSLQSVMLGLVGGSEDPMRPWALHCQQFASDGTIFEEALSMLRAKGFASMQLEDAISILNRRRDLIGDQEMIDLT